MEWLDGKDMEQILREKGIPFAEDVAKSYFKQLVDGLKFLHSLGIVHRDIKAENIILCRTENTMVPKFIDFGFAKKVDIKEDNKALCGSHKGLYQSTSFLCDF
jgi:serine/threonine protein kinase